MGEVIKLKTYEFSKTLLKGVKAFALSLAGIAAGAIIPVLQDPDALKVLLGQAKLPLALAMVIPAVVAALLNWNKNKDN